MQFDAILDSYYNLPAALSPNCFIQPINTSQISQIVAFFSEAQCTFAVKAGGHMLYVGSNAIRHGVTIDLRRMNRTRLNVKTQTASVEAGAKWGEVYTTLEAHGYFVPGAEASDVGVAGLTLGGGLSFFAARYGLVCDNVKNFELVLGNGTVTNANALHNSDLFKALKGGSGNLGLVTRFDFVAHRGGDLWGGRVTYDYADAQSFQPLIDWTNQVSVDPNASVITFWGHNATSNQTLAFNLYEYTGNATEKRYYDSSDDTTDANAFPAPFANFTFDEIGAPLPGGASLGVASLYNLTSQLNLPSGLRNIYAGLIFKATTPVLTHVNKAIQVVYELTYEDPPYSFLLAEYQPLPYIATQHGIKNSGNVLGLDKVTENVIVLMLVAFWEDPTQDTRVRELMDATMGNVTAYTQSVGAYRPWQYVNYAYEDEDPIGSYGDDNVRFLKNVSHKYDPGQTFQRLAPGGWKLRDAGKRKKQFNFNQFERFGSSSDEA